MILASAGARRKNQDPTPVYVSHTRALDEAQIAALDPLLSASERDRRDRLWRADDRRDYAAAHALLRIALAAHTGQAPEHLAFRSDGHGKPSLVPGTGDAPTPAFSLSHSRGLVACAIADRGRVGIDVEPIDPGVDALHIAASYFSADEAASLQRCSPEERPSRFCELWTLKEAFLKAIGTGLAWPPDCVSFRVGDGPIAVVPTQPGEQWAFELVDVDSGYKLAVAIDDSANRRRQVDVTNVDLAPQAQGPKPRASSPALANHTRR